MSVDAHNYNLQNQMLNVSCCCPVAKFYQDHQGLQCEHLQNLVTFGGASVSRDQRLRVIWLTAASQCFRTANFENSLSCYGCVARGR